VRLSGSEKGASEGRSNQNTGQGQFLIRPRLLPPTAKEGHSDREEAHDQIHACCGLYLQPQYEEKDRNAELASANADQPCGSAKGDAGGERD